MNGFQVTGWGTALPDKVVTNADLVKRVQTSEDWIVERTGILERRIGGTTSGLAIEASRNALDSAGLKASDLDLIILATTTPDQTVPATSPTIQHALGANCGAFDINAACSGFVYGMVVAQGMLRNGLERILLIGAETLSKITDWDDRSTCILFADGAGAVVIEPSSGEGLLGWDLCADGSSQPILYADIGSTFKMEGREVYRRAVKVMVASAKRAMERAGVTADEIKMLVPHQANLRIIEAATKRLGIPLERTSLVLQRTGNVSAASVPLALGACLDDGRLDRGDLVLFSGFGAGMTVASAIVRW
ncbi:MAG: 3-oxoacyl-[acyl-carrier-protein] synthase-3 [Planctomycetota bacterium]|jgi:3-oxoacyl-[acyl-carrier-protein] synthase-3